MAALKMQKGVQCQYNSVPGQSYSYVQAQELRHLGMGQSRGQGFQTCSSNIVRHSPGWIIILPNAMRIDAKSFQMSVGMATNSLLIGQPICEPFMASLSLPLSPEACLQMQPLIQ